MTSTINPGDLNEDFLGWFWSNVKNGPIHPVHGRCWQWTGRAAGRGTSRYGYVSRHGIASYAHRIAWIYEFGAIPEGMYVLHECDNRFCIRPTHLFLGTYADNNKDCRDKGRFVPCKGTSNGNSKITEDVVRWIRRNYYWNGRRGRGSVSNIRYIMRVTSLSQAMVLYIVKRMNWKHIS